MATSAMSPKKKAAFATPDRDGSELTLEAHTATASITVKTVTPPTPNVAGNKQVRFDKDDSNMTGSSGKSRGLVSRRGGRYGSPSRSNSNSTTTAVLEYKTYRSPKRETRASTPAAESSSSIDNGVPSLCSSNTGYHVREELAPSQISCDKAETTSPLHEEALASALSPSKKKQAQVTFSPRPSEHGMDKLKKTPTRSPSSHHFHNLPSLQDAKLSSPCGIFLSPCPPSPSAYATIAANPSFDTDKGYEEEKKTQDRERAVATPTDFALDFGKGHQSSASFDASNVLAWLQSPTANGLFSPGGGLGSALNTPRARTPRTPTHTSFFFSDVASLPRNGEFASPKSKRGGASGGMSSMISISPLASSKRRFSPRKPRSMPMLGDSPSKKELDAVHMAERDLMEDEDLSVLLQLASHSNTPRSSKDGSDVFRSPRGRKGGDYRDSSNPALQLPIIGGHHHSDPSGTTKLARKNVMMEDSNADDFAPPPLGIRSSSSGASREVFSRDEGDKLTSSSKDSTKENDSSDGPFKKKSKSKKNRKGAPHSTYAMPPYPPRDAPYYTMPGGMPAMPPGGSMRVVVGAPPPRSKKSSSGSPARHSQHGGSPPRHPHYPMPPDGYGGPHPPGSMYPPPPHYHHPSHMGVPPPPHMGVPPPYYPHHAPHHMPPMYQPHPPSTKSMKGSGKKSKGSKSTKSSSAKRPAPVLSSQVVGGKGSKSTQSPASKKPRKSSPKASASKKKKTPTATTSNPAVTEAGSDPPVNRQKTAAAIAAVNAASGGKNDRAAALAAAILRGVTMRPSGKWQAQLYYAGKSRYIGVFDTREKAALAYEIAREKLKSDNKSPADQSAQSLKATENAVNAARKAAFEGVNEKDPRVTGK
mmetsp:Transcript_2210/g.3491  ORF Transcript_2210/g.3491 Transcript_2210/m.3491 type:complete len:871 (+) Transcript_2210:262-2874(+)